MEWLILKLRASREHILIVRPLRALGISLAVRSAVDDQTKSPLTLRSAGFV